MTKELQSAVLAAAQMLPVAELPRLIGQLAEAAATAQSRLTVVSSPASSQHDELVPVSAAADRLGVSMDYLYRHAAKFSFTRREGRKLLFSSLGIDEYIRKRGR